MNNYLNIIALAIFACLLASCSQKINTIKTGNSFGSLQITEEQESAKEMNGMQTVDLKVNLHDYNGKPVSSSPIHCSSNRGAVNNFVFTDSLGVAFVRFIDYVPIPQKGEKIEIPDEREVTIESRLLDLTATLRLISIH